MARKSKLPRYREFNRAQNAFGERARDPKTWSDYLDADKPLILELGCGKAEFSRELANRHKDHNFIGIDLKADRLWRAAKDSLAEKQTNIAFMQSDIRSIGEYFAPNSVETIWITFPDPYPKYRQIKHRMLNREFLDIYKNILKPDGEVHFKTDNLALFAWAVDLLSSQDDLVLSALEFDLHASEQPEETKIKTFYEEKFLGLGLPINYLSFNFS